MEELRSLAVVVLGSAGNGKSTLCNRLITPDGAAKAALFKESSGVDPETLATSKHQGRWAAQLRDVTVIDTPGLHESGAADEAHLKCMVDALKDLPGGEVDAALLCFNMNVPRFVENEERLVRLFANLFKRGNFWDNIALVFTMTYGAVFRNKDVLDARRADFTRKLKAVIAGMGVAYDGAVQCFFVDSADMDDPRTRDELVYLRQWVASRTPMSTVELVAPSARFVKEETETQNREVQRSSVPITEQRAKKKWDGDLGKIFGKKKTVYETVQVGTRTTITWVQEQRTKQTRYDGEVSYTPWTEVRRWNETV